jgi:hypothetical protein
MTGEEKLFHVGKQVDLMLSGLVDNFVCPYCGGKTPAGEEFCCGTMTRAVTALLDAREKFKATVN